MKVLVLDDDNKISNMIKSLLEKYFSKSIKQIDTVSNVEEAVKAINAENYQLYLFDIHLGNETSFEIFNQIEKTKAKLIFITGHEKYAINAIKHQAVDYILKPINISEFKNSVEKVLESILKEQKIGSVNQFVIKQENSLILKALESIKMVKLNEVVYLEASGPYTEVYLTNGDKITVTKHLKDFENKLENTGFYRIHNSFIINTLKMIGITKKDGYTVEMQNNKSLAISSRRKDDFMHFLEQNLEI
ncbi:LytR/AlgR family response regulator transcription factor [Flavobacterium okayamense]|uniref:Sensory transduction protein LytR n=1 Tax=Flavobacterium okayamense TaxID=2830782 RepID=A0ABN6HZ20_9FLAO|nr:LytTR family DNA-binding domain-containing protein [Flavobacterium okayamense]BCY29649.1 sensory transduction protein LytR [Flavobacterium okayamense]